eukprot:9954769-Ditylum_brightwellii.AAC.1
MSNPSKNQPHVPQLHKEFSTKAEFFGWKHTHPTDGNMYCIKNKILWVWCTKCKSWGNHEQKSCCCHAMSQTNMPSHTKAAYKASKSPFPSEDPINIAFSDEST